MVIDRIIRYILGAGLALGAGAQACAQHEAPHASSRVSQQITHESDDHEVSVTFRDGRLTIVADGAEVFDDVIDSSWRKLDLRDEGGDVFATVVHEDGRVTLIHENAEGRFPGGAGRFGDPGTVEAYVEAMTGLSESGDFEFEVSPNVFMNAQGLRSGRVDLPGRVNFTPPPVMLGVTMSNVGPELAAQLGVDPELATTITSLVDGLAAERDGLELFDVIVGVNGSEDGSNEAIRRALRAMEPGDTIELRVVRKGRARDIEITPDAYDPEALGSGMPQRYFEATVEAEAVDAERRELIAQLEVKRDQLKRLETELDRSARRSGGRESSELRAKRNEVVELRGRIVGLETELETTRRAPRAPRSPNAFQWYTRPRGEGQNPVIIGPRGVITLEVPGQEERIVIDPNSFIDEDRMREAQERLEQILASVAANREEIERRVALIQESVEDTIEREVSPEIDRRLDEMADRLERLERLIERALDER